MMKVTCKVIHIICSCRGYGDFWREVEWNSALVAPHSSLCKNTLTCECVMYVQAYAHLFLTARLQLYTFACDCVYVGYTGTYIALVMKIQAYL